MVVFRFLSSENVTMSEHGLALDGVRDSRNLGMGLKKCIQTELCQVVRHKLIVPSLQNAPSAHHSASWVIVGVGFD